MGEMGGTKKSRYTRNHNGMLPCFLGGRVSRFESVFRNVIASTARV